MAGVFITKKKGESNLNTQTQRRHTDGHVRMEAQVGMLPRWLSGKDSACNAGETELIPGLGRSPGERQGNPLQYSCLENLHGQRSLVGYNHEVTKNGTQLSD